MSAKRHDLETDYKRSAPPCTIPISEAEARVEKAVHVERAKRIGELNGPWSFLLKLILVVLPIFIAIMIGWSTWVTNRIHGLEEKSAVTFQIVAQIKTNTEMLQRHEREIAALQAQFDTRTRARDREMNDTLNDNRLAHADIVTRMNLLSDKIDRIAERLMARE